MTKVKVAGFSVSQVIADNPRDLVKVLTRSEREQTAKARLGVSRTAKAPRALFREESDVTEPLGWKRTKWGATDR